MPIQTSSSRVPPQREHFKTIRTKASVLRSVVDNTFNDENVPPPDVAPDPSDEPDIPDDEYDPSPKREGQVVMGSIVEQNPDYGRQNRDVQCEG